MVADLVPDVLLLQYFERLAKAAKACLGKGSLNTANLSSSTPAKKEVGVHVISPQGKIWLCRLNLPRNWFPGIRILKN
jgi:hypothetical protein